MAKEGAAATAASTTTATAAAAAPAPAEGANGNGGGGGGGGGDVRRKNSGNGVGSGAVAGEEACDTSVLETLVERYRPHAIWFFAPSTPCACVRLLSDEKNTHVL